MVDRGETDRAVTVDIYVSRHCAICVYSHEVADLIQRDFPEVSVRVIDIESGSEVVPDAVFATPTFLLNGRLWSLGNPCQQDVTTRLSKELAVAG